MNSSKAGPNQVVAIVRDRARPKGSTASIDNEFAHLWTLLDGRVVRFQPFTARGRSPRSCRAVGEAMSGEDAEQSAATRSVRPSWPVTMSPGSGLPSTKRSAPASDGRLGDAGATGAARAENRGWPNAGVFRGRAAALARMQSLPSIWSDRSRSILDALIEVL